MNVTSVQDLYGPTHTGARRVLLRLMLVGALLVTAAALAGVLLLPTETPADEEPLPVRGVSRLVYPATLVSQIAAPADRPWVLPAAAVPLNGATYVIDTGDGRVLKLDSSGRVLATFDSTTDPRLILKQPMAMATDGSRLFIANSLASEVVVLDPASGRVEQVLTLKALTGREKAPRPIGIALLPQGRIAVSDADNHRVLILDAGGKVINTIGTGNRAGGSDGFNVPAALAVDKAGSLYVVDTLNGRVAKFAQDGSFISQIGEPGDTAGTLARPKGVAVDSAGRVFVSDGLSAAVQVFSPDGAYLGVIGRVDPTDPVSDSLFRAPAGLWLDGDRLYVADRIAGLVTLRLTGPSRAEIPSGSGEKGR